MMEILITGGLGNLGLWLTEHFLDAGHSVDVLGRKERVTITDENYRFIQADISDYSDLSQKINKKYDACIHTASYNEHFHSDYSKNALLINSLGTQNLCQSLLVNGVDKFIYFSTFHVYGKSTGYIDEKTEVAPVNDYGLTHYFAEKYIEKYHNVNDMQYIILRLSNSYGCPKDINTDKWYLLFNDLCRMAYSKKEIVLNSDGSILRDFIWMGDVVQISDKLISNNSYANDIVNLASGESRTILSIANTVRKAYEDFFRENIDVHCKINSNNSDKLVVSNCKLQSVIPHTYLDKFYDEAISIFNMLTKNR